MSVLLESFIEDIQAGKQLEATDAMPDEYRQDLINLLTMQADSELSGAYGYVPWIEKAPTIHEKYLVSNIVRDEVRHAYAMNKLLMELGVDVDRRIQDHNFSYRTVDSDLGATRLAEDKRVNIFYYTIDTWTDFIMFNFCMDRAAGHQLEDAKNCSYAPWARTIKQIFEEEMMHVSHGDLWVKRLAANPDTHNEVQESLNKWYPRTMNIFGRPGTERNKRYQQFRLKLRDNDEVRQAFVDDLSEKVAEAGLTLPAWVPDYDEAV